MPSTRDIRRRIKSVKNTAQITKAMQMVAASKMRKAQQAALAGRPYAELMNEVLARAGRRAQGFQPSACWRSARSASACVILVSTDKGLCGGLNSNLMREAAKFDRGHDVSSPPGARRRSSWRAPSGKLAAEFTYKDAPLFAEARAISKFAQDLFLKGEVDRVDILFTNFISTLVQKPEVRRFCPIGEIKPVTAGIGAAARKPSAASAGRANFFSSRTRSRCWARCCRTV